MASLLNFGRGLVQIDWSQEYLTFEALESGTFQCTRACSYSLDNGVTWTSLSAATDTPTLNAGDRIMWKASNTPNSTDGVGTFSSTGEYNAMGNPLSMRSGDNFKGVTTMPNSTYTFYKLFQGSTKLISAENIALPCTTIRGHCYRNMFYGCSSLTTAPKLVSTAALPIYAYCCMFRGCSSLTTVPEFTVSFNTSSSNACDQMFISCASLVTISFTTTGSSMPYRGMANMFSSCTSLQSVNTILSPTTITGNSAYTEMFSSCTSLISAPRICAITDSSTEASMANMFKSCTSLVNPPIMDGLTTLKKNGCIYMFDGCSKLESAPYLPAATLNTSSYNYMFRNCSKLKYIKCLATNISASGCLYNWLSGVASGGTFVKHPEMASWPRSASGIPSSWTVLEAVDITVTYENGNSGAYIKEQGTSEILHTFIDDEVYEGELSENKIYEIYDSNDTLIDTLSTTFNRTYNYTI